MGIHVPDPVPCTSAPPGTALIPSVSPHAAQCGDKGDRGDQSRPRAAPGRVSSVRITVTAAPPAVPRPDRPPWWTSPAARPQDWAPVRRPRHGHALPAARAPRGRLHVPDRRPPPERGGESTACPPSCVQLLDASVVAAPGRGACWSRSQRSRDQYGSPPSTANGGSGRAHTAHVCSGCAAPGSGLRHPASSGPVSPAPVYGRPKRPTC